MVAFEELDGSPKLTFDVEGGVSATRRFLCAWSDLSEFVGQLIGAGGEFGTLRSTYPTYDDLYVTNVEARPYQHAPATHSPGFTDPESDINVYEETHDKAEVICKYRTLAYDLSGTPFSGQPIPDEVLVDYRVDSGGEFFTFDPPVLFWETHVFSPVTAPFRKLISITTHELRFYNLWYPPYTAIAACKGHVNNDTWLGFATETLLFEGASFQKAFAGFNDISDMLFNWNMVYRFTEKRILEGSTVYGWNHFWRPEDDQGDAGWERLTTGTAYMYGSVNFSQLFQFGQA